MTVREINGIIQSGKERRISQWFTNSKGYYNIHTILASTMTMDIQGTAQAGSQVILYEGVSDPEQLWYFTRNDDDGTYTISPSSNPFLSLSVDSGATANNAKVKMATKTYTLNSENQRVYPDNQKWYLEPISAEEFDFEYMFDEYQRLSKINSGYKLSERPEHAAIDIIAKSGDGIDGEPIYAPCSGKILYCNSDPNFGYFVKLQTDTCWKGTGLNLILSFFHMKSYTDEGALTEKWQAGDRVYKGDLIGYVGNTGDSDGSHLHYEVYKPQSSIFSYATHYHIKLENSFNPQRFHYDIPFTDKVSSVLP